jgi:hypothetical protein
MFNLYRKCLTKENPEGFGDFNVGEQIIRSVKNADDLVLLAKHERVLRGIIERLTENRRWCGMEMNVEKSELMRISRQPSAVQITINQSNRRM